MKKVFILIAILLSISIVLSSCKLDYKTEGTGADMHFKTNMAEYNAVSSSIWELNDKYKTKFGAFDNGKYTIYRCKLDANSSVLRVDNYTSQSPYPKFFVNQENTFPEFNLENIFLIRFFNVDNYKKCISTEESASAIDKYKEPELIRKLYDAVTQRDNKAAQYPDFESYPKLGFLEWNCSGFNGLSIFTDIIQINSQYFIIVRYGYDDQPRDLIQIDGDVVKYLLNNAEAYAVSYPSATTSEVAIWGISATILVVLIIIPLKLRKKYKQ